VGDCYAGLSSHHPVQRFLHLLLVLAVQGRGGLVQEEQSWPAEDGPSDGHSLFLAARDVGPLDPYVFVEPRPVELLLLDLLFYLFLLGLLFAHFPLSQRDILFDHLDYVVLRVEIRLVGRCLDFLFSCFESVVLYVFSDGVVEEDRLLTDHADM
jgi:hypothetical protein